MPASMYGVGKTWTADARRTMSSTSVDAGSPENITLHRLPDETVGSFRRADDAGDITVRSTLDIFKRLAHGYGSPDFILRFWDGSIWTPDGYHPPRFTITLHHPGAL